MATDKSWRSWLPSRRNRKQNCSGGRLYKSSTWRTLLREEP